MLIEYSYSNKKAKAEVQELVGSPFTIWQRLKMNGNGSQRLVIISGNEEISKIITTPGTTDPYINIELRPKGIIIHLKVRLDNWALILPYHTLSIFSQDNKLTVYSGKWKLQLTGYRDAVISRDFIQKILRLKNDISKS